MWTTGVLLVLTHCQMGKCRKKKKGFTHGNSWDWRFCGWMKYWGIGAEYVSMSEMVCVHYMDWPGVSNKHRYLSMGLWSQQSLESIDLRESWDNGGYILYIYIYSVVHENGIYNLQSMMGSLKMNDGKFEYRYKRRSINRTAPWPPWI